MPPLAMLMSAVGRGPAGAPADGLSSVFQSDWAGVALGTSTASKGDGGKWNLLGGSGQEVVATTGLDMPGTQCLKINALYSNSGFALNRVDTLTTVPVGTTRYWRGYMRMTFPDDLVGNGDHPWQDGNAVGDCNYIVGVHYGSDSPGSHLADWQTGPTILPPVGNVPFDNGPWMSKGTTYRLEWAQHNIDDTDYDFSMRIYASDGNGGGLLYGPSDFPADSGGGTLATRGPYEWKDVAESGGFNCGTNDFETAGNDWWNLPPYNGTFEYGYQGAFAIGEAAGGIRGGTWVGPYGAFPGES